MLVSVPNSSTDVDLLIVGGGINGAGIARDAAGRGLRVCLVEQDDFAQHTSSASTKLIHGGLRYLEYGWFRLVREALQERERLLHVAPHLITPLRFVLPEGKSSRPRWMIALGLFLYDWLGGKSTLERSKSVRMTGSLFGAPLRSPGKAGFAYSDCRVDDSRLVIANLIDAKERGAQVHPHAQLLQARRVDNYWLAEVREKETGRTWSVTARVLVNAGGPWVSEMLNERLDTASARGVRLVKGSHFVVAKLYEGDHAYLFQNPDRRIVFTIPYNDDFTLVGTTDIPWDGPPGPVTIDADEADYLCDSVNRYFTRQIKPADIVWAYSGLRPLYNDGADDASSVTRDYVLDLGAPSGGAALLSIFGGKITTYRVLAEHALEKLAPFLDSGKGTWTSSTALPGGEAALADIVAEMETKWPFLGEAQIRRMAHAYGTRAARFLGPARTAADLGTDFGCGLSQAEVLYLMHEEWARSTEDILWRRSKLGLRMGPREVERLADFIKSTNRLSSAKQRVQ